MAILKRFIGTKRDKKSTRFVFQPFFWATITLVFLLNMTTASAATYNVDNTGSGDFTTIQEAVNIAQPGDNIIVSSGDYTSEGRIKFPSGVSGTLGNLITIKANPRRSVTMAGFIMRYTGSDDLAASYIRIEGFNITNDGKDSWAGGIVIWGDGTEVVDNYFYSIIGPAIRSNNDLPLPKDAYIANNYIYACNKGIEFYGENWIIEYNEIERLVRPESGGYDADYMRAFGNNITIRYNYCHGTLLSEVGTSHTDGVQTWGTSSGGIGLHDSIIEKNIFMNFHQGIQIRNDATAASNLIIRNNVFDDREWYDVGIGVNVGGGENISAVNNIICGLHYGMRFRNDSNPLGVSGTIMNNIFVDNYLPLVFDDDPVSIGYNLIYDYTKSLYNEKTDMLDTDPMLVNIDEFLGSDATPFTSDDGYRLKNGSPAINNGFKLQGIVDDDILGSLRNNDGVWDIGPYEFNSGSKTISKPSSLRVVQTD